MIWIQTTNAELGDASSRNNPQRAVSLNEYCIDNLEMSVARYSACVRAGRCPAPDTSCNVQTGPYYDDFPVRCVSFTAAQAACGFEGKRLPTQDEWEYAARGPRRARTPATDDGEPVSVSEAVRHFSNAPLHRTAEDVDDITVIGIGMRGMAGNVSEWTASTLDNGRTAIVHGGSFLTGFMPFGSDVRVFEVTQTRADVGLRCALTPTR
jgi:formylglycine-generating enzyme required for sulfatase activity